MTHRRDFVKTLALAGQVLAHKPRAFVKAILG